MIMWDQYNSDSDQSHSLQWGLLLVSVLRLAALIESGGFSFSMASLISQIAPNPFQTAKQTHKLCKPDRGPHPSPFPLHPLPLHKQPWTLESVVCLGVWQPALGWSSPKRTGGSLTSPPLLQPPRTRRPLKHDSSGSNITVCSFVEKQGVKPPPLTCKCTERSNLLQNLNRALAARRLRTLTSDKLCRTRHPVLFW